MPVIVAFVSQKGGVGKSSLTRALAVVAARAGLEVNVADLDPQQQTIVEWLKMRVETKVARRIRVEPYETVYEALEDMQGSDLLILDTPARANRSTLDVAKQAHLIVLPSSGSLDDLRPAVLLLHELVKAGIERERMVVAFTRILNRNEEIAARTYVETAGYEALPGSIGEHAAYRDAQNRGRALNETNDQRLNEKANALLTALLENAVAEANGKRTPGAPRVSGTGGAA